MADNREEVKVEEQITKVESDKVLVCLKHPQGIKFNLPNKRSVVVKGNADHLRGLATGVLPSGGFGMTTVDKTDWIYIKKTYGGMKIFKTGLIFASSDADSARDQMRDHDEIQSGLEPVDVGDNTSVKDLKKVKKYKKDA